MNGKLFRLPHPFTLKPLTPPVWFMYTGIAIVVGALTGYTAVLFITVLNRLDVYLRPLFQHGSSLYLPAVMFIAGLIGGPMVIYWASEARGHGVPEVIQALVTRNGRIRPRVAIVKFLASAVTLGSGGSAGREGPIVQIGAAIGSVLAQWLRFSKERVRVLVAAGAASGIAATFNAPIGGVIFALEIILGEFSVGYFGIVVIAAVVSSVISQAYLGTSPAFHVPSYRLEALAELPMYVLVGILSALFGIFFIKILYGMENVFEKMPVPPIVRPAIGLLLTGSIGLLNPMVLGPGLHTTGQMIAENMNFELSFLVTLVFLKIIVTSFTLGSGNSGGVFAPSLFAGAALGGSLGLLLRHLFPSLPIQPGAYALAGMASLFSAVAHAPITSILIVFEMSGDYRLILPLMLSTVISTILSQQIHQESIYTLKLARRGITVRQGRIVDIMEGITVEQAMHRNPKTVSESMPLNKLGKIFTREHVHGFPVLNDRSELVGIIALRDYEKARMREDFDSLKVGDVMSTNLIVAYPEETLWDVMRKFGVYDVSRLPVVDPENPKKLLGLVRRRDVIRAYNHALERRAEMEQRILEMSHEPTEYMEYITITLNGKSKVIGRKVKDIRFPSDCLLVSIRRGKKLLIPHGETIFQQGDQVTIFTHRDRQKEIKKIFASSPP